MEKTAGALSEDQRAKGDEAQAALSTVVLKAFSGAPQTVTAGVSSVL